LNYAYIESSYRSAFSTIMMSSLCQTFQSQLSTADLATCLSILNGSPDQGLTESLTHFVEGLIFLNNLYENYRQDATAVYFWTNETYVNLTGNNQEDNILNLLRSDLAQGICNHLYY